jgi:hypothetical protein
MSSNTQFWRQSKKPVGWAKLKEPVRPLPSGRNFIFRVVLPGVLLFVACHHLFFVTPESGELYMKWAATGPLRHVFAI